MDIKINYENIGKIVRRCYDLNIRLEKLMWDYFMRYVEYVE